MTQEEPTFTREFTETEITKEVRPDSLETNPRVTEEIEWAKKYLSSLIDTVIKRYSSLESTLVKNPEQLKEFIIHNEEILDFCIKRGIEKGMDERDLRLLEVSAILHDLAKADTAESVVKALNLPEGSESIGNLVLAMHHDLAADKVNELLEKNPEIEKHILGGNYTEEDKRTAIDVIKNAIRSHMGPHPGFMDFVLAGVNKALEEKGGTPIKHPFPKEGDVVAETLLAADMRSLAGRQGRKKVLSIRKATPFFASQDLALVEKYKAIGIDLKQGEAALLSGFDSAKQARDMLPNEKDREWLDMAIEESKTEPYNFDDYQVTFEEAYQKREQYNKLSNKNY